MLSVVRISKHPPFRGADCQDHGRLSIKHRSKLSRGENSVVRTTENGRGAVGTSTRPRETGTHVLTPSSVFRDTTEKLAHILDSSVRVSHRLRLEKFKTRFFVCHCLGAWEPGTCGHDTGTRNSWRFFHTAQGLAGATKNSDGKRRTIGDPRRYDVSADCGRGWLH